MIEYGIVINSEQIHRKLQVYQIINILIGMSKIKKIILTFLLAVSLVTCNVWDNIFSQTGASSPIILSQSLNFLFPLNYEGVDFDCNVDYNHNLKLLTIRGVKNLILLEVQVFRLQIDLQQFLISFKTTLAKDCKKYKLILTEQDSGKIQKISISERKFLVNILFKFVGRNKKDKSLNQFVFSPDLMTEHEVEHEQFEKNPLLIVDRGGNIVKVFTDIQKKEEIPLSTFSKIKEKLNCPGIVEELTKQDLYEMLKDSIQNKDYQKIPGFENLPLDKIPIDKIPFDKLPKIPKLI